MTEIPAVFGSEDHLVGVLTLPANGHAEVACLMLNFGVTQRIGPHRINVKLARRLAAHGVASFRFDLSGVGDSKRPTSTLDHGQQAVADLQAAMDRITVQCGITRFAILGLCSGSVHGFHVALSDPRVVGLMIFDAFAFTTRLSKASRAWLRLAAIPRNRAVFGKTVRWARRILSGVTPPTVDLFSTGRRRITPGEFEQAIERLLRRGVAVFFVYTGTLHAVDGDRAQLGQLRHARFLAHVRYEFMADVDHTVTSLTAQGRVLDAACSWVLDVVSGKARPHLGDVAHESQSDDSIALSQEPATQQVAARQRTFLPSL